MPSTAQSNALSALKTADTIATQLSRSEYQNNPQSGEYLANALALMNGPGTTPATSDISKICAHIRDAALNGVLTKLDSDTLAKIDTNLRSAAALPSTSPSAALSIDACVASIESGRTVSPTVLRKAVYDSFDNLRPRPANFTMNVSHHSGEMIVSNTSVIEPGQPADFEKLAMIVSHVSAQASQLHELDSTPLEALRLLRYIATKLEQADFDGITAMGSLTRIGKMQRNCFIL